jgi:16S rRNA (guanine966-N2)-methyltransferase
MARVRESLFAILEPYLEGAVVLDLFAGTGGLGLEALRRGAARAVFVESDPRSLRVLQENLRGEARATVVRGRLPGALERLTGPFDLILADPPYGSPAGLETLGRLEPLGRPGSLAVFEHHHKEPYPERCGALELFRRERYGETALSFYRWTA